jgi:hypothetical protein
MKINRLNLNSWVAEVGGLARLDVDASDFSTKELVLLLERMGGQLGGLPGNQTNLSFNSILTNEQCLELANYIKTNPDYLPFSKLSLCVNSSILKSQEFIALTEALNNTSIQRLHLDIPVNSGNEMAVILTDKIAASIHYAVTLGESSVAYKKFANQVMQNMQRHNLVKLLCTDKAPQHAEPETHEELDLEIADPLAEKIKLKELIQVGLQDKAYDQYIKLEVQYVEVEQKQQVEEVEEVIEEHVEEQQQQEQEQYDGDLIGYQEFRSPPYNDLVVLQDGYELVKSELFGNLSKAIKFLSRDAATVMAKHLSVFSSFNADNLPQNFILKKTAKSELVLDYDLYAPERKTNVYTPKEVLQPETGVPIYDVTLPKVTLDKWIFIAPNSSKQLDTMWIKYGDDGVKLFFDALKHCERTHKGISEFLFKNYLNYFQQWSQFLDDKNFLGCIDKIKNYDATKLACLKKFLETTGSSRHDLKSTLEGFDAFWNEWERMSLNNKIDIGRINTSWKAPIGCDFQVMSSEPTLSSLPKGNNSAYVLVQSKSGQDPSALYFVDRSRVIPIITPLTFLKNQSVATFTKDLFPSEKNKTYTDIPSLSATQLQAITSITGHNHVRSGGGNPLVYMERLLTILRNTRNVSEQLDCLDGITLSNYGAYYASKYEGFNIVSKEMGLNYDLDKQNQIAFNPNAQVYRVELEGVKEFVDDDHSLFNLLYRKEEKNDFFLIQCEDKKITSGKFEKLQQNPNQVIPYSKSDFNPPYRLFYRNKKENGDISFIKIKSKNSIPFEQFHEMAYRFLGEQKKGIPLKLYAEGYNKYMSKFLFFSGDNSRIVFTALFFMAHERYSSGITDANSIDDFLNTIERLDLHKNVIIEVNRALLKLYQLDTRLSPAEGMAICDRIGLMNSAEFEGLPLSKNKYIKKLFECLQNNKYATLKCLKKFSERSNFKWPFAYALDTAEYLANDARIAQTYQDDLLLFSSLISSEGKEVYFEGRNDEYSKEIIINLDKIKNYLVSAVTDVQPNNLDYAFKTLVRSNDYFTYAKFLKAFDKISQLKEFNFKEVDIIFAKHQFKLGAGQPEVFSRSGESLKVTMISLIMMLRQVEKYGVLVSLVNPLSPSENVSREEVEAYKSLEKVVEESRNKYETEKLQLQQEEQSNENDLTLKKTVKDSEINYKNAKSKLAQEEQRLQKKHDEYLSWQKDMSALSQLDTKGLQVQLREAWNRGGTALSVIGKVALMPLLAKIKAHVINEEFSVLGNSPFVLQLITKIHDLKSFSDGSDFEKIDRIAVEAASLAELFARIMERENFKSHENEFTNLFKTVNFSSFEYEILFNLLSLLASMPQRDYLGILKIFFTNEEIIKTKADCVKLLDTIQTLHNNYLPSAYIEKIVTLAGATLDSAILFSKTIIPTYRKDKDDTLLKWMVMDASLSIDHLLSVASLTKSCTHHRDLIQRLLLKLHTDKPSSQLDVFLKIVTQFPDKKNRVKILEIIARSEAVSSRKTRGNDKIDYADLATKMNALGVDGVERLYQFFETTTISVASLYNGLKIRDTNQTLDVFLPGFEKAPFGERDWWDQFDITHVERVINNFKDLNNQAAYTYTYRKQVLEAFLFINKAGYDLPMYLNKPAKDLSNQEIQQLFLAIKLESKEFAHLDPFQRRLYALGLMREAMYRSTGQFPYSTQIIGLIDCMMHQGDVISNIDTGQGKSLVDTMKAALLWLESDRVDVTTSSMVDAKRDSEIYSPFLTLLGIPHTKTPIASSSPFDAYQAKGINYSTMAQLALFYSKAKGEGVAIGKATDCVSLVMNESDYIILDEKTIYRYATSSGADVGVGNEWIYTAINEFIHLSKFKANTTSGEQDIALLKKHLISKGNENKKSPRIVNKFPDEKLLTWIESAIIVNYRLREKFDYIVTKELEERIINGISRSTRVAKILMKDGKVSPDTQYGNGMQQLLHAKLNNQYGSSSFVIDSESKTIISLNNRNMIDYYRSKKGFIWGSSGTVGYGDEIDIQYLKYGFEFSEIEPHQQKKVTIHKPIVLKNEKTQFKQFIRQIKQDYGKHNAPPALVFLKDIETAERFYEQLQAEVGEHSMQLYAGMGNEEKIIQDAAKPSMVTVTTAALGRNTDVLYDKKLGMTVYDGFFDAKRKSKQKSGRTGRQGSPGNIYTILNQQDFPGLTIEQAATQLEKAAEKEREFNEELYNILGYFLKQVDHMPKEFFRREWAGFSDDIESYYRQSKLNRSYQLDHFVQEAMTKFNELSKLSITKDQVLEYLHYTHPEMKKQEPYQGRVTMADCTPPDVIAYHFLNSDQGIEVNKEEVKAKLTAIFVAMSKNKSSYNTNKDYIGYLNAGVATKDIRAAHEAFLSDFLIEQANVSKNRGFLKRWLGFQGHLNKIVSNENYLLIFKAMSNVRGEKISAQDMASTIKLSITTLLNEYLQNSWFISSDKRQVAKNIIQKVEKGTELGEIVKAIQKIKLTLGERDITVNKDSFWRRHIKPVHAKGYSRLQSTLDRALALTASLTHEKVDATFVGDLTGQLKTLVTNPEMQSLASLDTFKVAVGLFQYHDKSNAAVVTKSIETVLKLNARFEDPAGMVGRFALFQGSGENKKKDLEIKSARLKKKA